MYPKIIEQPSLHQKYLGRLESQWNANFEKVEVFVIGGEECLLKVYPK